MPEQSFESKFGQLVDAILSEKVPSLLTERVGFQIIDKTDDEKRAVGISAFVVNGLWLYIPAFFIEGDLKGMNLLYVKQNDIFVPARDNWISLLRQQGPAILGKAVDDEQSMEEAYSAESVDINESPIEKESALKGNEIISKATLAKMSIKLAGFDFDFSEKLKGLGKAAGMVFANTLCKSPEFANAVFEFYSPKDLQKIAGILKTAAEDESETIDKPAVTFINDISQAEAKKLTDDEKKILVQQGMYVRDDREVFSKVFYSQIDPKVVQNPATPGIYDILMSNGEFKPMLVLFIDPANSLPSGEICCPGDSSTAIGKPIALIDFKEPKHYFRRRSLEVFCRPAQNIGVEIFGSSRGGYSPSKTALIQAHKDKMAEEKRDSFGTMSIGRALFVQGASRSMEVEVCSGEGDENGDMFVSTSFYRPRNGDVMVKPSQLRVDFTGKPGKLHVRHDRVIVPDDSRIFLPVGYEEDRKLSLGSVNSLTAVMTKQASLEPISIYASGDTAQITSKHSTGLLRREDALRHLVLREGIFAGQAQQLLKEASRSKGNLVRFMVKYAAPYDVASYQGKAPFMGGPQPKSENAVTETEVEGQGKALLPAEAIRKATGAAQSGIKEVFDTEVLKGLVDVADVSELRKDYIADMLKGMDKVGRMLFLFYWHNDEFEDRYGKNDMTSLEDKLNQVFVNIGDLVLFLKEKIAYSPDTSESLFGALSEDVGEV